LDLTSRFYVYRDIFKHVELPAKLLDYFLRSHKSNINQCCAFLEAEVCHTVKENKQLVQLEDDIPPLNFLNIYVQSLSLPSVLPKLAFPLS